MRCRDLFFILSWKYKDKQSNASEENDSTGGVIADRAPRPHKTENKKLKKTSPSRSRNIWNHAVCIMLLATPVPHQLFSASMHLCLRQEGRKMECECARLVVHARHCFKRSSYWNGKEWRRAGGEEQATRGSGGEKKSEREQRGHWRAKNPFVTSIDC